MNRLPDFFAAIMVKSKRSNSIIICNRDDHFSFTNINTDKAGCLCYHPDFSVLWCRLLRPNQLFETNRKGKVSQVYSAWHAVKHPQGRCGAYKSMQRFVNKR